MFHHAKKLKVGLKILKRQVQLSKRNHHELSELNELLRTLKQFGRSRNSTAVISARYVAMLENFVAEKLNNLPGLENPWFQQDGATAHTTRQWQPFDSFSVIK